MDDLPEHILGALRQSLDEFFTAHRAAVEEWALVCLRKVDPRCWETCVMLYGGGSPASLTLLDPAQKVLGVFAIVERDGQLFFHGQVFE